MGQTRQELVSVVEASRRLGVSLSTVWRRIRRGSLPTVRRGGRRLVPSRALISMSLAPKGGAVPGLGPDHPIFRLVGAGRGGAAGPGARDKHAILDVRR